jgi:FkbM family methyltransferase
MVFYDYIEIGTCDFRTEIEKQNNKIGISIEPLKYYFDKLKDKENCIKLNIGISDKKEEVDIHYIDEETIIKYKLHPDVRGSSSIYNNHQYIHSIINELNMKITPKISYDDIISKEQIKCISLYQLYKYYNINNIFLLKIDTEGHDKVILNKFIDDIKSNNKMPFIIIFESNYLIEQYDLMNLYNRLINIGYDLKIKTIDNSLLQLNLNKLKNKTKFTEKICGYYISNYPHNYDINNLPHGNTLEEAQEYCKINNYNGITYQYGRYEVRVGKYIQEQYRDNEKIYLDRDIISWIYI